MYPRESRIVPSHLVTINFDPIGFESRERTCAFHLCFGKRPDFVGDADLHSRALADSSNEIRVWQTPGNAVE